MRNFFYPAEIHFKFNLSSCVNMKSLYQGIHPTILMCFDFRMYVKEILRFAWKELVVSQKC